MAQRINVETASSVISGFYDAAYGRANWADALKPLTETLHSARSCIFHLRASGCNAISDVEDQELNSRQSVEMLMRDPLGAAYGRARPGEVYRREALIDEEALRNRPLWTDLFRARDMARDLIFRIPVSGPDEFWTAQIHRGQGQGDFSEEEIAFFRLCVAHVARAGEIGSLLKQRQSLASASADLPVGMVLLDEAGLPTSFNARAETLLGRPNAPLTLRGNLLHCQDPKHLRSFDRLLRSVLARDGTQPGGSLVLGLGTPQQMVATIAPYQTSGLFGTPASRQAVVLLRQARLQRERCACSCAQKVLSIPGEPSNRSGACWTSPLPRPGSVLPLPRGPRCVTRRKAARSR